MNVRSIASKRLFAPLGVCVTVWVFGTGCAVNQSGDYGNNIGVGAGAGGGVVAGSGGQIAPPPGAGHEAGTSGGGNGNGNGNGNVGGTGGTGGGSQPPPAGDSEWCRALSVFRTSCQTCHGDPVTFGAPFSLVTYAHTQGTSQGGRPLPEVIKERVHDTARPMPPVNQTPLTEAQKAAIAAWVDAGAPTSDDPTCGGQPEPPPPGGGDFEWPADCEEFFEFRANDNGQPHRVRANTETHPDFMFNVPWGGRGPVQALAVKPITDNARVLHHWILYQGNTFLTGWSPGTEPEKTPAGIGMFMPDSGQLRLDVHYYNMGNNRDELDASGVEICITRTLRPNTAAIFPFVGNATARANTITEEPYTCAVNASAPITLMGSSPHMHKLGVHAKFEILRAGGRVEVIHDLPFSFEDQYSVPLQGVTLNNGDQVRVTCRYANNTNRNVTFGTSSDDEMCFNFMRYYPRCGFTCTGTNPLNEVIRASQGGICTGGGGGGGRFF